MPTRTACRPAGRVRRADGDDAAGGLLPSALGDAFAPHVPSALPPNATYGLLDEPLAYWSVAVPRPAHVVSLTPSLLVAGGQLQRRLDCIVGTAGDRFWLLGLDRSVDPTIRAEMSLHHLAMAPPCFRAESMVWIDAVFCRGRVTEPRADAAADLAAGQRIAFSKRGFGLIYEIGGWDATEPEGVWAEGSASSIAFHPAGLPPGRAVRLTFQVGGINGAPTRHLLVQAGGGPIEDWAVDDRGPVERTLCVGPRREPGDVVTVRFTTPDVRSLRQLGLGDEPRPLALRLYAMALRGTEPDDACGTPSAQAERRPSGTTDEADPDAVPDRSGADAGTVPVGWSSRTKRGPARSRTGT